MGGAASSRIRVWDLPTRVFHWTLAACVGAAFVTGFAGGKLMELHGKAGIVIAGLLAFRLVWGIAGSTHARFASFVRGPAAIRAYLRGEWRGVGHNPLGALSVLALLALSLFQAVSGLFGNDDIAYNGPLYTLVDKAASDLLTGWHHRSAWLLLSVVALHVGAAAYHFHVKKDNLVLPMLTGWKNVEGTPESVRGGGLPAFIVAAAIGAAAAIAASGVLLPPPPPPAAPAETPAW